MLRRAKTVCILDGAYRSTGEVWESSVIESWADDPHEAVVQTGTDEVGKPIYARHPTVYAKNPAGRKHSSREGIRANAGDTVGVHGSALSNDRF